MEERYPGPCAPGVILLKVNALVDGCLGVSLDFERGVMGRCYKLFASQTGCVDLHRHWVI